MWLLEPIWKSGFWVDGSIKTTLRAAEYQRKFP